MRKWYGYLEIIGGALKIAFICVVIVIMGLINGGCKSPNPSSWLALTQ